MSNVLDTAILFGLESTYGTPATLTRAFEGKADSWKRAQDRIESTGFYSGQHAKRSDRIVTVNMGGEGSLEIDVLNSGFGLLLQAMLGSVSGPTQIAATAAYKTTAATTDVDPDDSFTVQVQRTDMGGTQRNFTHHGCVMTGWTLSQDVGGLLTANMNFDFEDVDTSTAAGTPSYPTATAPFDWTMAVASLDSVSTDVRSFELNADLMLNTERRFLRGSELKKQPVRSGIPVFTGSMEMEFEDLTQYDDFVAGNIIPITLTWTGAVIDSPEVDEVVVTMAACQYTGESPQSNLSDLPVQNLPFEVLWDGTNPAVQIDYTSADTAL